MLMLTYLYCSGLKKSSDDDDAPVTCLRQRSIFNSKTGKWDCTEANLRECTGSPGSDDSKQPAATTAFGPSHLIPLVLSSIKNGKLKPSTVEEVLKPV